jgi:hypothetical protein
MPLVQSPQPVALDCALAVEYLADALTREGGSIGNRQLDELLDGLVEVTRSYARPALNTLAANPDDEATRSTSRAMILEAVAVDGVFGRELELLLAKIRPFGEDVPPATVRAQFGIVGERVGPRLRADRIADSYLESFFRAPLFIKLCVVLGPLLGIGGLLLIFLAGPWDDVYLPFDTGLPEGIAWTGLGLCSIARWALGNPAA